MAAPAVIPFPPRGRKKRAGDPARLKRKIDQTDYVLSALEERVSRIDQQMKRLQQAKRIALGRAEKIENATLAWMQEIKAEQLIGNAVTLSTRANAASLQVLDQSKVPAAYIREKLITEVDKIQVKAALARGEEIEGVRLLQSISLLRRR